MQQVKIGLVVSAVFIAAASLVFSHFLVRDLTNQEHQSMAVWAEAVRSLQTADDKTDLGLVLKIINGNNTIPVVVVDNDNNVLAARNLKFSQDSIDAVLSSANSHHPLYQVLQQQAEEYRQEGQVITLQSDTTEHLGVQKMTFYVCYSSSIMLQRLSVVP